MSKPRRGRPPKLAPELVEKLCQALAAGNYRTPSAEWAGIAPRTFHEWMRLGKEQKTGKYRDFRRRVLEAEKSAEIRSIGLVMKAAAEDPRHAEWWLERKFPQRWGRREAVRMDASIDANIKAELQHDVKAELVNSPERLSKIAGVLVKARALPVATEEKTETAAPVETKEEA